MRNARDYSGGVRHFAVHVQFGAEILDVGHGATGQHDIPVRADAKCLGSYAERAADASGGFDHQRHVHATAREATGHHLTRQRIELGAADELGHAKIVRVVVDLVGRAHLHELAVHHHGDPVGHRHRLGLIVRHVDECRAQASMQLRQFRPHMHT